MENYMVYFTENCKMEDIKLNVWNRCIVMGCNEVYY